MPLGFNLRVCGGAHVSQKACKLFLTIEIQRFHADFIFLCSAVLANGLRRFHANFISLWKPVCVRPGIVQRRLIIDAISVTKPRLQHLDLLLLACDHLLTDWPQFRTCGIVHANSRYLKCKKAAINEISYEADFESTQKATQAVQWWRILLFEDKCSVNIALSATGRDF